LVSSFHAEAAKYRAWPQGCELILDAGARVGGGKVSSIAVSNYALPPQLKNKGLPGSVSIWHFTTFSLPSGKISGLIIQFHASTARG